VTIKDAAISSKKKLTNCVSEIYKPVVNLASMLDPRYKLIYTSSLYMSTETSTITLKKLNSLLE